MAGGILFIGWGRVVPGRERWALQLFAEATAYYDRLQAEGEIDGYEPYALGGHGGDLAGFVLLRGDRARLERLRTSEAFVRLHQRADLVAERLGVVTALGGEDLERLFASFGKEAVDLLG